jgi:hypothetical protein
VRKAGRILCPTGNLSQIVVTSRAFRGQLEESLHTPSLQDGEAPGHLYDPVSVQVRARSDRDEPATVHKSFDRNRLEITRRTNAMDPRVSYAIRSSEYVADLPHRRYSAEHMLAGGPQPVTGLD